MTGRLLYGWIRKSLGPNRVSFMMYAQSLLAGILVLLLAIPCYCEDDGDTEIHIQDVEARYMERGMIDGMGWRQFTDGEKGFYLLGFEDGAMGITIHFIFDDDTKRRALGVLPLSVEDNPPLSEIVKKIDAFYSDDKNLEIPIYYVVQIIRNRLIGIDESKIESYIQYLREGASGNLNEILEE